MVLGGRTVPIQRPRVRTMDGQEVRLASYGAFHDERLLTQAALERMLHGLSTRRYHHAPEPMGDDLPAVATSESSVNRHFVIYSTYQTGSCSILVTAVMATATR